MSKELQVQYSCQLTNIDNIYANNLNTHAGY